MSDIIDTSQEQSEFHLQATISHIRNTSMTLVPKKECYNCFEPLEDKQLFCDSDCSIDYDKRERNKK